MRRARVSANPYEEIERFAADAQSCVRIEAAGGSDAAPTVRSWQLRMATQLVRCAQSAPTSAATTSSLRIMSTPNRVLGRPSCSITTATVDPEPTR